MEPQEQSITLPMDDGSTLEVRRISPSDMDALGPWLERRRMKHFLPMARDMVASGEMTEDERIEIASRMSSTPVSLSDIGRAWRSLDGQVYLLYRAALPYNKNITEDGVRQSLGTNPWMTINLWLEKSGFDTQSDESEVKETSTNPTNG